MSATITLITKQGDRIVYENAYDWTTDGGELDFRVDSDPPVRVVTDLSFVIEDTDIARS